MLGDEEDCHQMNAGAEITFLQTSFMAAPIQYCPSVTNIIPIEIFPDPFLWWCLQSGVCHLADATSSLGFHDCTKLPQLQNNTQIVKPKNGGLSNYVQI